MRSETTNYAYDDHSSIPFKFVVLKPTEKEEPEHAHRHNFFQIFFFTTKGGQHVIDFETSFCEENSVHIVNPGSIHMLTRTKETNGFVLLFSRAFFNQNINKAAYFLNRNDFKKFLSLPASVFQEIQTYLQKIQLELNENKDFKDRTIPSLLELIIITIQRNIVFESQTLANENDLFFDDFKTLVDQNFSQQKGLQFYADALNISKQKLNVICLAKLNKSANTILQERLILEAKRLLFYSRQSIKEIAFSLGYDDPSYFNRFFKSKVNETPKDFRLSIREKYH